MLIWGCIPDCIFSLVQKNFWNLSDWTRLAGHIIYYLNHKLLKTGVKHSYDFILQQTGWGDDWHLTSTFCLAFLLWRLHVIDNHCLVIVFTVLNWSLFVYDMNLSSIERELVCISFILNWVWSHSVICWSTYHLELLCLTHKFKGTCTNTIVKWKLI